MTNPVKVVLYAVLVLLAGISGYFALTSFGQLMSRAGDRMSELERIEPERKIPADSTPEQSSAATNEIPAASGETNATILTNLLTTTNSAVATKNTASVETNVIAPTSSDPKMAAEKDNSAVPTALSAGSARGGGGTKGRGRIGLWTGVFVVSLIALGLMIAGDLSHYFGNRALKVIYNDEGEGMKNPEYEQAEEVWASGKHLEAIRMMREYLSENPREQHVAIRIAEIYEKDLKNNLAAALEYEEVLKHKLAPERWGWAGVHLCNLYFKIGQEQKGFELLRRIVKEHPGTAAAEKARKRLEQVDGSPIEPIATEQEINPSAAKATLASQPVAGNLPPGFRPKK